MSMIGQRAQHWFALWPHGGHNVLLQNSALQISLILICHFPKPLRPQHTLFTPPYQATGCKHHAISIHRLSPNNIAIHRLCHLPTSSSSYRQFQIPLLFHNALNLKLYAIVFIHALIILIYFSSIDYFCNKNSPLPHVRPIPYLPVFVFSSSSHSC